MIEIDSIVKMDWGNIRVLTDAQETALEQTADYLQSESGQAQENPHAGRENYHPEDEVKTRKSSNARGEGYNDEEFQEAYKQMYKEITGV